MLGRFQSPTSRLLLLTLILGTLLAGCDNKNSAIARSGMASPMRYDEEPIKQRLKGNYFTVPANCYDSPLEVEGNDQGYTIDDSALLVMLLPDLQCRTRQNKALFQVTGPKMRWMLVLIQGFGRVDHVKAFNKVFDFLSCNDGRSTCVAGSRRLVEQNAGFNHLEFDKLEYHSRPAFRDGNGEMVETVELKPVISDVYYQKDRHSYTICERPYIGKRRGSRMMRPMCRQNFLYRNIQIQLSYARNFLRYRDGIELLVKEKLNSFLSSRSHPLPSSD